MLITAAIVLWLLFFSLKFPSAYQNTATVPSEVPADVASDGRASLMESIRKAGGKGNAKLRSVKERKLKKKAEKEQSAVSGGGGGDLMGDLFAKLSMRRKGISGSKGEAGSSSASAGGGSAMDKISAMIPAPPKNEGSELTHSGGGDDWD